MELVVRTPHGDADVTIGPHPTTTVGELVAEVTGQAVARLLYVDGHVVEATTDLRHAGVHPGSVVTTDPATSPGDTAHHVEIMQVAGHGAGRSVRLGPGRYRFGPGRRSYADELDVAPVEQVAFDVVVEATGTELDVTVVSADLEVTLDGVAIGDTGNRWHDGLLAAGPRAFRLERPTPPAGPDSTGAERVADPVADPDADADSDGTINVSRSPRRPPTQARRPAVDAARDAAAHAPTLWERRPDHADAYEIPLGVGVDNGAVAHLDLRTQRAVAITGSERFRQALARSIMVEAATVLGPADLEIVVATDPARLARWDWAKWLPHLRQYGAPRVGTSRDDLVGWADRGAASTTLLIVDDRGLWSRRDAPLRSIASNPPEHLLLVALCDDATRAPSACTTVISETADGFARLERFGRAVEEFDLRPALVETSLAEGIARALAPLVDLERAPARVSDGSDGGVGPELTELIGPTGPRDIHERWAQRAPGPTVTLGRNGHEVVEAPVADDVTVVIGSSIGDAFDVAFAMVLADCVQRPPDALWVVPLMVAPSARSALLWELPHATDQHDDTVPIEPRRVLQRLRGVLADPGGPNRIVLVVEVVSATPADHDVVAELVDAVHDVVGLALVVITDDDDGAGVSGDTTIRVECDRRAVGAAARRQATLVRADGSMSTAFDPVRRTPTGPAAFEIAPFVVGRALTALERRVEQRRAEAVSAPGAADGIVRSLREAASLHRQESTVDRIAVPRPMPVTVDLDELFAASPGDGVPVGVADDPSAATVRTRWWELGSGSLLVFGSRRSGMDQVLTTIVLGLVDRFSDLDVRLAIFEPSSTRRRALAALERNVRVITPDRADDVAAALDDIATELDRHAGEPGAAQPRLVIVVNDLGQLRQHHDHTELGQRLDDVLGSAAAPGSGADIIASTSDLHTAGPLAALAEHRLVGTSSNRADLTVLGVDHPDELDGIAGRCRALPGGDLVQIATTDVDLETLIARRTSEGPT